MPPLINGLVVSPSITKWGNCLPEFLRVIEVLEIHELKNFIMGLKIYLPVPDCLWLLFSVVQIKRFVKFCLLYAGMDFIAKNLVYSRIRWTSN